MPSSAVRFNSSRRQILRTYTERTFYPEMTAQNIPYGAKTGSFSGMSPTTAEAVGTLVGTVGAAATDAALGIYGTKSAREAEREAQREATRTAKAEAARAEARGKTLSTILSVVPWVVGGAVVIAGFAYFSKRNRSI